MNTLRTLIAASLFAASATAMAVEATQWNPPAGNLTRAEVMAEYARARANGELPTRGEAYAGVERAHQPRSTLTRAEVKEELARARANGELQVAGEAYGGFPETGSRTRAVHARKQSPNGVKATAQPAE